MEKSKHYERNMKTVHAIEHHLYCYTEASFNLLIALGRKAGYEVAHVGTHEDDKGGFRSLDLVKKSTPDMASIETQGIEIEAMAEKANADYDGWGTEVEA